MGCNSCYKVVEEKIGSFFERIGKGFIAKHPWKIIIAVILVNGLLGIGMLEMEQDIDVARVYTPMNSQAVKDEEKVKVLFPDRSGSDFYENQLTLTSITASVIVKPNGGTILDQAFLNDLLRMYNYITATVSADENNVPIPYTDICAIRESKCVVNGAVFVDPAFNSSVGTNNVTYPTFTLSTGEPVQLPSLLSGVENTSTTLTKATHLQMTFYLRSDTRDLETRSKAWVVTYLERMEVFAAATFDFAYAHSDSLGEELNANIGGDIGLFSATFTIMITYACVATYSAKHDCVGNRVMLGLAGALAAGLGIIASFGLVSAAGMSFVSIVGNVPFLIIGIGMDDMFILLSGMAEADYSLDMPSRIGRMLRTSGVAITITSLTDVIAFAAGASATFKSVRNFCVYTGVAIVFCYINQAFMFSACLAINEDRVNDNRHILNCKKTRSKEEMRKDNETSRRVFCCAGTRPTSREEVESALERYPSRFLSWFVLLRPVKVIVLIGFAAYLGLSIWGAMNLEQGLVATNLVADDSYYFKYRTWNDELFSDNIPVGFYFDQTLDYSAPATQTQIQNLIDAAKADRFMSNRHISWLDAFLASTHYTTPAQFVNGLKLFLNDNANGRFKHDVVVTGNDVTASRIYVFANTIDDSQDQGQMMLNMRDVASASGLPVTAFHAAFVFYEQYVAILPQTLQTLGIGIAAVLVITAIFMPNPILLIYVIITMGMIITGVIGFMKHWDLTLSSITMIHLIMSVGFAVDYTAHICHGYMVAEGRTRDDRVRNALQTTGAPIFNGAISSILGILMLSFAKSYIFKSFFQVMFLVVIFGLAHAVLFLPVLLSLIGPGRSKEESPCGTRNNSVNDGMNGLGNDNPVVVVYNGKDTNLQEMSYKKQ